MEVHVELTDMVHLLGCRMEYLVNKVDIFLLILAIFTYKMKSSCNKKNDD